MRNAQILALILLLLGAGVQASAGSTALNVQVREGCIRAIPSALGSPVATVTYGETLLVIEERGAWVKVQKSNSNVAGWIPRTSLTPKKIKISAGNDNTKMKASSGELALAGKGFNSQVESEYRAKNKEADFATVDAMEKIRVSTEVMQKFLKEGGLVPAGDQQK